MREKPVVSSPKACNIFGIPFISKSISEFISRLQKHGFKFEDEPYEILILRYPKCKAALRWWCNQWGNNSNFNIKVNKGLKEFLNKNPPDFNISSMCCTKSKKEVAKRVILKLKPDLQIIGVRSSEGGVRSSRYKSCFSEKTSHGIP
jgi:hypothetical protein